MNNVIVAVAQYAIWIVVAALAVVWLVAPRRAKLILIAQTVVGAVVLYGFAKLAADLHSDPRPFVVHPNIHPLFAHARDGGFPSDHALVCGLIAGVILWRRQIVGVLVLLVGIAIGAARVLAHVHHTEDIVAGLLLGLAAAAIGILVVTVVTTLIDRRRGAVAGVEGEAGGRHAALGPR